MTTVSDISLSQTNKQRGGYCVFPLTPTWASFPAPRHAYHNQQRPRDVPYCNSKISLPVYSVLWVKKLEEVIPINLKVFFQLSSPRLENLMNEVAWYIVQRWCVIKVHWLLYNSHTTRNRILTHAMPHEGAEALGLATVQGETEANDRYCSGGGTALQPNVAHPTPAQLTLRHGLLRSFPAERTACANEYRGSRWRWPAHREFRHLSHTSSSLTSSLEPWSCGNNR